MRGGSHPWSPLCSFSKAQMPGQTKSLRESPFPSSVLSLLVMSPSAVTLCLLALSQPPHNTGKERKFLSNFPGTREGKDSFRDISPGSNSCDSSLWGFLLSWINSTHLLLALKGDAAIEGDAACQEMKIHSREEFGFLKAALEVGSSPELIKHSLAV